MVPTRTNVAAGIPSSKVKFSMLSSTGGGHLNRRKETWRAEASFKWKWCPGVVRSHLLKFKKTLLRFLRMSLPASPCGFQSVPFSLSWAASCWRGTPAKWAPARHAPFGLLSPGVSARVVPPAHWLQSTSRLPGLLLPRPSGLWWLVPSAARRRVPDGAEQSGRLAEAMEIYA